MDEDAVVWAMKPNLMFKLGVSPLMHNRPFTRTQVFKLYSLYLRYTLQMLAVFVKMKQFKQLCIFFVHLVYN